MDTGLLPLLAIGSNTALNVGVQISPQEPAFSSFDNKCPEVDLLAHTVIVFNFLRN